MARNEQLTFVIRAKNLFAKTFDSAKAKMRQLAAGAVQFGRTVATGMAVATAAVLALGRSFLRAWEIQARAEAKLAAILKATGYAAGWTASQLKKLASQLQRQTGIGDEVILNTQAILATFKEIRGEQFREATQAILDMSIVMGGASGNAASLESATVMIGKALQDPIRGATALRRAGVQLTKQQEEQIKVFVESGRIVQAQSIILAELKSQFGGAASEGNATVRAMDLLKGTFGDMKEQIGGAIANSDKFQAWLESLQSTIDNLAESGQLEIWAENVVFALDNIAASAKYATAILGKMFKGAFLVGRSAGIMADWADEEQMSKPERALSLLDPIRMLDALAEANREWEEQFEKDEVKRKNFREARLKREQEAAKKEAEQMAAAHRAAAMIEASGVVDGLQNALAAVDSVQSSIGKDFAIIPDMDEGQMKTALMDLVDAHAVAELKILQMLENEREAYARAAESAEVFMEAVKDLPEGADPKTARGWGTMQFYTKAAEAIKKEREELQKSVKPMADRRKEAERLLLALDEMEQDRQATIRIDAETSAIDAKIAGLEKEISALLFLDQTDPREERAALFERKENAKRIARETAEDEKRFADLQERQRMGRHITRRSREWMAQFEEGRGRIDAAAAKRAEIDALQRQTAQNTKDSADALKTIKTNLDTLLRAS